MRLTEYEVAAIKKVVRAHFGPDAKIFLFGSRVDDAKKGGDIDLLVEYSSQGSDVVKRKLQTIAELQLALGDQKIDIVTTYRDFRPDDRLIVKKARETGVRL